MSGGVKWYRGLIFDINLSRDIFTFLYLWRFSNFLSFSPFFFAHLPPPMLTTKSPVSPNYPKSNFLCKIKLSQLVDDKYFARTHFLDFCWIWRNGESFFCSALIANLKYWKLEHSCLCESFIFSDNPVCHFDALRTKIEMWLNLGRTNWDLIIFSFFFNFGRLKALTVSLTKTRI